ncbi:hypothetical protein RchiOBHm_Chr1g0341591 [Rosa chinensis]|uniref:Uncharacterized protein n=1 Tax=Rosa chinensis TaxID=74649 RepID=A0A2P6SDS8_ROSCH|nr:hypothetical protein RchiOBHm_Chr1g0341591 [Rosa chinensis]
MLGFGPTVWVRPKLFYGFNTFIWVLFYVLVVGSGRVHYNFGIDNLLLSGLEVVLVLELGQQRWRNCLAVTYWHRQTSLAF